MSEKEVIEKEIADAFIELYNFKMGTSFCIIEYSDAPDIRCKDSKGSIFNFEITLTEDRPKDIQAMLGRSDHRSVDNLKKHLADIRSGKKDSLEIISCLEGNVTDMIVGRIQSKIQKSYGSNIALVVRDSSPVCWDWELVADHIKSALNLQINPFDKGIWVITFCKDRIFRLV